MSRAPAAFGVRAFPWQAAMAFGFGRLRHTSRDFWNLTPRELGAAIEALHGSVRTPLDRAGLAGLMARFPDE